MHAASQVRIIPAYAGSTPSQRPQVLDQGDHPRIRGEHSIVVTTHRFPRGSSPHTRGALEAGAQVYGWQRIIPAYAGSTFDVPSSGGRARDHPRIRGEHWQSHKKSPQSAGSSPHTRGAPLPRQGNEIDRGIIPAYAGSTSSRQPVRGSGRDHPRIRGEHVESGPSRLFPVGSSPHTRGARAYNRPPRVIPGIIPAYAGSTSVGRGTGTGLRDHPRIRGEHPDSR